MASSGSEASNSTESLDGIERFHASDRADWRAWLEAHHASSRGVWLIYNKKGSGKPRVAYADAVEEALCFGWIDSRANPLDEERYTQFYCPRRPRSPWSRLNRQRAERLLSEGRMAPAGLAAIEAAKRNGLWTAADAIDDQTMPEDLAAALVAHPAADRTFAAFSTSTTRQLLRYVASAKRPGTRATRISLIVAAAAEGRKPLTSLAPRRR
jgi:uncharacterized protein YdeI (YjbR/CyaY-like superfamily)